MRATRVLVSVVAAAGLLVPSAALAATDDDPPPPWAAAACPEDPAPGECPSWRDDHRAVLDEWRATRDGILAQWRAGDLTTQERNALLAAARTDRAAQMTELREARQAAKVAWRLERGAAGAGPGPQDPDDDDVERSGDGNGHQKGTGKGAGRAGTPQRGGA